MSSEQEKIINELVNEIYNSEQKIKEINERSIKYNNIESSNQFKNICSNIDNINIEIQLQNKILNKKNEEHNNIINLKKSNLNKIQQDIDIYKQKLINMDIFSFSDIIPKYILNNQEPFLSKEQIEIIINNNGNNNKTDLFELNKLKSTLDNKTQSLNDNNNNLNKLKCNINQYEELLNMLIEDMETNQMDIINYISSKESLFEIIQQFIQHFKTQINEEDYIYIDINIFELGQIDALKATNFISDNLFEILDSFLIYNDKELKSNISESAVVEQIKQNLYSNIKEEIISFIKSINLTLYISQTYPSINNFFSNIQTAIFNSFTFAYNTSLIKVEIKQYLSENNILYFLNLSFKYLSIDKIVENKLNFINKDYKAIKKEIQVKLNDDKNVYEKTKTKNEILESEIQALNIEYDNIKINIEKQKNILNKEEKCYLDISSKSNMLINKKEEINKEIEDIQQLMKKEENEIENKIFDYNKQIDNLNSQKIDLKKHLEEQRLKDNKEIIQLRELIANKYSLIKNQLSLNKNTPIYNILLNSINSTIQSSKVNVIPKNHLFHKSSEHFYPNSFINNKTQTIQVPSKNDDSICTININNTGHNPRFRKVNNKDNNKSISYKNLNYKSKATELIHKLLNNSSYKKNDDNLNDTCSYFNKSQFYKDNKEDTILNISNTYSEINKNDISKIDSKLNTIEVNKPYIKNESETIDVNSSYICNNFRKNIFNYKNNSKPKNIPNPNTTNMSINLSNYNKFRRANNMSYIKPKINTSTFSMNKSSSNIPCNISSRETNFTNLSKSAINNIANSYIYKKKKLSKNNSKEKERGKNLSNISINSIKNTINVDQLPSYMHHNKKNKSYCAPAYIKYDEKIMKLNKVCLCYYRAYSKNNEKLNPLEYNNSEIYLLNEPYNFKKGNIVLNINNNSLIITNNESNMNNIIKIEMIKIEGTLIHSSIKKITEIIRIVKKNGIKNKEEINKMLNTPIFKIGGYSEEDVYKSINNKIFNFSIIYEEKKKIEIVLDNFEDFKTWINGVAYIAKNKGEI